MVYLSIALSLAVLGLLASEFRRWRPGVWIFKPLASLIFVSLSILASLQTGEALEAAAHPSRALFDSVAALVVAGACLSLAGDVLLIPRKKAAFLAGIAAFLGGHLAFAGAFVSIGLERGVSGKGLLAALAIVLPAAGYALRTFVPRVSGALRVAVPAYVAVIGAMVCCAFAALPGTRGAEVAAVAFFVSDLAVARQRFVKEAFLNKLWGLPLYYFAQWKFAMFLALWESRS